MGDDNKGIAYIYTQIAAILIIILLIFGGLGLAYFGYVDYKDAQSSIENSVKTEGEITSIGITEDKRDRTYETEYRISIEYDYTYQGSEYSGSGLTSSNFEKLEYDSRELAEEVLDGYEEGENVTVYVNSKNPSESFLEKRGSNEGLIFSAAGLFMFILGILTVRNQEIFN